MTTKNCVSISRKEAAELISSIAQIIYEHRQPRSKSVSLDAELESLLNTYGITLPYECTGEAHSNPNIDHCSVCTPGWGLVERPIKVK